ncbi:MAG TPA: hypothetical protein VIW68_12690 [Candidatus Sulfotelmatobacter sp.]
MNRRNFLNLMIGGVAASAAVRTWPFRVYSFGKEPKWFDFDGGDIERGAFSYPRRQLLALETMPRRAVLVMNRDQREAYAKLGGPGVPGFTVTSVVSGPDIFFRRDKELLFG